MPTVGERWRYGTSNERVLLNKKILLVAALLSGISSCAYACMMLWGPPGRYGFCGLIALLGAPGLLLAVVLSIAALGGAHGGGPLGMLLIIATPINFLLYVGLGLGSLFRKWKGRST